MKSIDIKRYQPALKKQWDDFIKKSQADCLLFYRDFMEYHGDRFQDCSLLFFMGNALKAVCPGHIQQAHFYSHSGLTFGGIITAPGMGVEEFNQIFTAFKKHLTGLKIKQLTVKLFPYPYFKKYQSTQEFLLVAQGARLLKRELNFFIDLRGAVNIHKSKRKFKGSSLWKSLKIVKTNDFESFWKWLLVPVLQEQFGNTPVHSIEEIELLAKRFPEKICQYGVFSANECVAGITLFISRNVVKSQYGVANTSGKKLRALDFLFINLIKHYQELGYTYFDMGTVSSSVPNQLYNAGLLKYKEELGASPYNLDTYTMKLQ